MLCLISGKHGHDLLFMGFSGLPNERAEPSREMISVYELCTGLSNLYFVL